MPPSNLTQRNPKLAAKISTMQLTLSPIFPLPTGPPHPAFPKTLLHFWLLTESELDAMAAYYSQSSTDSWTHQYPCLMGWDSEFFADPNMEDDERLAIKRRKFGKFIGLGGCETPVKETETRLEWMEERLKRKMKELRDDEERRTYGFNKWSL